MERSNLCEKQSGLWYHQDQAGQPLFFSLQEQYLFCIFLPGGFIIFTLTPTTPKVVGV